MKFNFDWNRISAGAPYITIGETGLGFNSPAIALIGNPEEVAVGFDEKNLVIGVKKYTGDPDETPYKFYSRIKNGWIRIGCKDFIKYLSSLSGVSFAPAKRYIAKFDTDEQILYISVMDAADSSSEE